MHLYSPEKAENYLNINPRRLELCIHESEMSGLLERHQLHIGTRQQTCSEFEMKIAYINLFVVVSANEYGRQSFSHNLFPQ